MKHGVESGFNPNSEVQPRKGAANTRSGPTILKRGFSAAVPALPSPAKPWRMADWGLKMTARGQKTIL